MTLDDLPTPALLLDLDRAERNIAAMAERARRLYACLTVACFDEYYVVRGHRVVDRWKIWRGR